MESKDDFGTENPDLGAGVVEEGKGPDTAEDDQGIAVVEGSQVGETGQGTEGGETGEATGTEEIRGEHVEVEHVEGEHVALEHVAGEQKEGEHVEGEHVQGEQVQGEHVQSEHVQSEHVQGEHVQGEHGEGEHVEGEHVEGEHVEGEHVEGVHVEGVHVEGEHVEGEHLKGEHVEGEHVEGEHVEGEHVDGEHVDGEHVEGEHVEGEVLEGEHVEGEGVEGEHVEDQELAGEHVEGEGLEGEQIEGEKPEEDLLAPLPEEVVAEEEYVEEPPPDPAAPYNFSDSKEAMKAPFELRPDQLAEVEQLWELYQNYTPAYSDLDGYVTEKELIYMLKSLLIMTYTEEQLQELIEYCCRPPHPEGHIFFDQFVKMVTMRQRDFPTEEEIRSALQVFDPEKTGVLDREQLREVLTKGGLKMTPRLVDNLIKEVDMSNDGTLGLEDIVGTMCIDLNPEDMQLLRAQVFPPDKVDDEQEEEL